MTKKVVTDLLNVQAATALKADIEDSAYYVFTAKYTPFDNVSDDTIPMPEFSRADISSLYDNMIFGRRIKSTDVRQMTKRYDWESGQIYDQYDDEDINLSSKRFYVLVTEGTEYNVYKCLFNNNRSISTSQPFGRDELPFETPEDGYIWKYMYTISDFEYRRFVTNQYIPVNTAVKSGAGSIDVIVVEERGQGYNNYVTGSFGTSNDIYINGDTTLFALADGSNVNKFYVGCVLKITSGLAINQFREVVDYYIADGQRIIKINEPFVGQVRPTDTYEVYPMVYIYDSGNTATKACVGRAIVDGNMANSIAYVEVLEPGLNYRSAISVIQPDASVEVTLPASVRAIVSPIEGHGADSIRELYAKYICVSTTFIGNTEVYTTENDYRTVGILRNPLYANVSVDIVTENTVGSFATGEDVYHYKPYTLNGTVSLNANSIITSSSVTLADSLRSGDKILVSDGNRNQYATVEMISNVGAHIDREPSFTSANCTISILDAKSFGRIVRTLPTQLTATNIIPSDFQYSSQIVGITTSTTSRLDLSNSYPLSVNGRSLDSFNSFLQLTKLVGTKSGENDFLQDEFVTQTADNEYTPRAIFHSMIDNLDGTFTMYLINVNKDFTTTERGGDGLIIGQTSGAQFIAQYKYDGELVRDSGQIMYIENINAVTRSPDQSETIKLILEC